MPVFRQVHGNVRAALAVLGAVAFLHIVFLALAQPGRFQHPLQDQLAPGALGLARALERGGEVLGVLAERLIERHQLAHLLAERGAVAGLLVVDGFDLGLELAQLLLQRVEQLTEVAAVLLGEALALLFQDVVGQVLELDRQILAHLAQLGDLFLRLAPFGVELGRQPLQLDRTLLRLRGDLVARALQRVVVLTQALQGLLLLFQLGGGAADALAQAAAVAHQRVALVLQLVQARLQFGDARGALGQLGAFLLGRVQLRAELSARGLQRARSAGAGQQPGQDGADQHGERDGNEGGGQGHRDARSIGAQGASQRLDPLRPCHIRLRLFATSLTR